MVCGVWRVACGCVCGVVCDGVVWYGMSCCVVAFRCVVMCGGRLCCVVLCWCLSGVVLCGMVSRVVVCVWCVAVAGRVWVCWGWVGLGRGCGGPMGSGRVDGRGMDVASGAGLEEEW